MAAPVYAATPRSGDRLQRGRAVRVRGLGLGDLPARAICPGSRARGASSPGSCSSSTLPLRQPRQPELRSRPEFLPLGLRLRVPLRPARPRARPGRRCADTRGAVVLQLVIHLLSRDRDARGRDRRGAQGRLRGRPRLLARVAVAALGAAVLVAPGVWPHLEQRRAMPEFHRTLGMAAHWAADLLDYARTNVGEPLALQVRRAHRRPAVLPGDRRRGARRLRRHRALAERPGRARSSCSDLRLHASLGPVLKVAGKPLWIPPPTPGSSTSSWLREHARARTPRRARALLAASDARRHGLRRAAASPRVDRLCAARVPGRARGRGDRDLVGPLLPQVDFPKRRDLPPIYEWLCAAARRPRDARPPVPREEWQEGAREVTRQLYAIYHKKPRVDSVSGFVSPSQPPLPRGDAAVPAPEEIDRGGVRARTPGSSSSITGLAAARARAFLEAVARAPGLERAASAGTDVAYRITGAGSR